MTRTPLSAQSRALLLDFFSKALTSFQESQDALQLICSLPRPTAVTSATPTFIPEQPAPSKPSKPTNRVSRLVVLDSSFNPPTLAHMRMASSAADAYSTCTDTRVLLLLSVKNADKAPIPASFPQRLAMMYVFASELLTETRGLEVDIALSTLPYFHDKCEAIGKNDFYSDASGGPPEQIYLAGYDTLIRIFNPKYYGTPSKGELATTKIASSMQTALSPFFDKARLRITLRGGHEWGGYAEQRAYLDGLAEGRLDEVGGRREWADRVEVVEDGAEQVVSSTLVREGVRSGKMEALDGLLSAGVKEWVLEEELYKEDE